MKKLSSIFLIFILCIFSSTMLVGCKKGKELTTDMISLSNTSYIYDGTEKKPSVIVKVDDKEINNTNYIVEYSNNIEIGEATVTITATNNSKIIYGSASITFEIVASSKPFSKHTEKAPVIENIVKATVGNDGSYDSVVYCDICGTEISRTPNKINKINESDIVLESGNYTYNGQEFTPSLTITNLVLDRDYTITYVNNVNAGTASVKITFKGNYAGEYTKNFVINAVKVEKPVITGTYT